MEFLSEQFDISQILSATLTIADNTLFLFYMVSVGYLFVFAVSSNFRKGHDYPRARKMFRYGVLFYVDSHEHTIVESVESFKRQEYPNYELIVVSNTNHQDVNELLRHMQVRVLIAEAEGYNKVTSIRYAMANMGEKTYDAVVIMDPDSEVDVDFLKNINDAYHSGCKAIQTHRIAKHLESDTAIFGAVSEEINNSIFRHGHVNLGFSSALIGSGMIFNFEWLKNNISDFTGAEIEKQMETKLLEQSVFIEYMNDVHVYGNKMSSVSDFYQERSTWISSRKQNFKAILYKLPKALISGNYDYCEKLFQWLIPSRTIIAGTLLMIAVILLFLSWTIAIKWWVLLLMLILTFSIALPDYLIDARFIKALRGAPILFVLTVFNSLKHKFSRNK